MVNTDDMQKTLQRVMVFAVKSFYDIYHAILRYPVFLVAISCFFLYSLIIVLAQLRYVFKFSPYFV